MRDKRCLGSPGMLGQKRIDHFLKLALGTSADELFNRLAVFKEKNCGNAHDLVSAGHFRIFVGIQLSHFEFTCVFFGQLIDDWRHHLARATPDSPKIHHHQLGRFHDLGIPGRIFHFYAITSHVSASNVAETQQLVSGVLAANNASSAWPDVNADLTPKLDDAVAAHGGAVMTTVLGLNVKATPFMQ